VLAYWAREAAELSEVDGLDGILPKAMVDHEPWTPENETTRPIEVSEEGNKKLYTRRIK
jgi:hypothetical protein